ncbi:MAG TPA: SET domain-containing protein [Planctomycetaceae bacterium]|jgi:hypothetical protein
MIHPDTELRFVNDKIGYGVFATRDIPRGTITWVRDSLDQAFSPDQIRHMQEAYQHVLGKYAYTDRHGKLVLCWDHARFMNHSCEATCLSAGYDFEIAIRDVLAGEELTDDYGTLNLESSFPCACASAKCRGHVHPEDSLYGAERWDELLRENFPLVGKVAQPLWWLVNEKDDVLLASADVSHMKSCRVHHVHRNGSGSQIASHGSAANGVAKVNGHNGHAIDPAHVGAR